MNASRTGGNNAAVLAALFLLSFTFVAYAIPVSAAPSINDSGGDAPSAGSPSSIVYFSLVAVSPSGATGEASNASGYAGITVNGLTLTLEWSVSGGNPGEPLAMAMYATDAAGTLKAFTFSTVVVSAQGTVGATETATLPAGTYSVGLRVTDPATTDGRLAFTSEPATATITLGDTQAVVSSATSGGALSYSLVPLPVYLHHEAPDAYPFKEGGALVVLTGQTLEVTTSILGAANTKFVTVVQTAGHNLTAGAVTTTAAGSGVFKGNVTLAPGTYQIGLLVFASGDASTPVAVSVPRAIQVTIASTTSTRTSSTHSTTSSSSSTIESETEHESSNTTTTSASSQSHSQGTPGTSGELGFSPVRGAAAPADYPYGHGEGGYDVSGGGISFSLAFTGQGPSTIYSLVLTANGTASTIGTYVTNAHGGGSFVATAPLGPGTFVLSLTVVDETTLDTPTVVLVSVPGNFTVVSNGAPTAGSTHEASPPAVETPGGPQWTFKLSAATIANVPQGYRFASSGTAVVTLDRAHSILTVDIGYQRANPSTTFEAKLVLNGTSENLGTMTTNRDGGALLHSSVQVAPGTYLLGIAVYDVSDMAEFGASAPVLVMVSTPSTELAVIVPPGGGHPSNSTSTTSSYTTSSASITRAAKTIAAGAGVQSQIRSAVENLTIPATVQVTPFSSSSAVMDDRFSLSVGAQAGNGLVIAISGQNVTGPRVLLVNMSRTSPLALYPALNVTLDGSPVAEASSALQVLNPSPTDPPMYVLVATSDSIQLLVSIPHFSLHLVQVAGVVVHTVESVLALDAPLLVGSMLVVTLAFAAAYASRKRYFVLL